jgi:lysophospholipase L1-like esterase
MECVECCSVVISLHVHAGCLLFVSEIVRIGSHFSGEVKLKYIALSFVCLVFALIQNEACAQTTTSSARTVFVGDSMLYGFNNFPDYLPESVVNLAVTASPASSALQNASKAASLHPKSVFVMTGTNDIQSGSVDLFSKTYDSILSTLEVESPGTKIYAETLFPVNWTAFPQLQNIDNVAVGSYNSAIRGVVSAHQNVVLLDFNSSFTDSEGNMKKEISKDGLHLNQSGYQIWGKLLAPYF